MIDFKNIQIKFGDFVAIDDLSLHINEGEFFTLLGPSGCGKTTLLRSLVGFVEPSKGTVSMTGNDITYLPIEKRGIGMVFQSYALFPTMTVRENIEFGMKEHNWPKNKMQEKVKEIAQIVNLYEAQLTRNVSELSGGQQQRVAIARSLSLEPDVICLDEPLSNLDAKLRKSLRTELKSIQKRSGATMIYVTHDQEEALALSDRIAVMNGGEIQQVGTPLEIYNNPANPFVADFIGDRFKIDSNFIKEVNQYNANATFDLKQTHYIKTEDIQLKSDIIDLDEDTIILPATLITEEFLGTTVRREFNVGKSIVPSVSFASYTEPINQDNSKVEIGFNKSDVLSFYEEK